MYDPKIKDSLATKRVRGGLKSPIVLPSLSLHFMERTQQSRIVK